MTFRTARATAFALLALVAAACSDASQGELPAVDCAAATSCAACTPIVGCGWCRSGDALSSAGTCMPGPDGCKAIWTWNPDGCHAPADAANGDAADAASD